MTRDELIVIVKQSNADTLMAQRMREALGIRLPARRNRGHTRDRNAKSRRYRGAGRLMRQRYGVKL